MQVGSGRSARLPTPRSEVPDRLSASDETAIVLVSGSHKKKLRGGRGRRALE